MSLNVKVFWQEYRPAPVHPMSQMGGRIAALKRQDT